MELEIMKMLKFKSKEQSRGFTLMELIMATAVFGILIVAVTGISASIIKSQRRALAVQSTMEALRYMLESASKEIRMSRIDSDAGTGLSSLSITNSSDEAVSYVFTAGEFRRDNRRLNSSKVDITGNFYVKKSSSPHRATVTVAIKASYKSSKPEEKSEIYVQNTISCRSY